MYCKYSHVQVLLYFVIRVDIVNNTRVCYVLGPRTMYSRPNQNQGEARLGKCINWELD